MNCVITLKINDYYPKLESIPYENFVCLFTYGDFFVKVPLIQKSNNICKHEVESISSDIKYNIHILESNESSLIGICEMIIPFIKIKKINAPGTMVQEQTIKLIIDLNTKRKLFGTLINSGDIYLVLSAEVFIPDKKNIILNTEISNINLSDNKKKNNNSKQIKVRMSNKKNNNMDGTPRTVKRKKMIIEMNNNREIIKKDNSNDNIKNNGKNNTLNNDSNNGDKNKNGIYIKKMKLDSNQVNIIDFRNKNDSLNKNNKYNENNNLSSKELKKKLNKKRSPKKITILELLEQKMQPLLSSNNEINNNSRSNTYYNNGNNISQNVDIKINNKIDKKKINFKNKNNTDKNYNTINNTVKRLNKNNENLKTFNSMSNSPDIFLSPNYNSNSPNTINTNKLTKNNTKILNRINRKFNNDINKYNNNNNLLNENEINNQNNLIVKNKRNSSQEEINRDKFEVNNYKNKKQNTIIFSKKVHYKNPNIDISVDMVQRKNNNEKMIKDLNKKNNSSYSNINNNDLTSNNGLLSTDERTEQGLSEIDKIILEKGAELREQFKAQLKNNNSNKKDLNKKNDNIINNNKNNNQKINQLYYDVGGNHIIGAGNFTFDTPKISKDFDNINKDDNKSPFSTSKNISFYFTQEDLKNNYIRLIDLYHLLNHKLSKTIFENNDLYKKLQMYKEFHNSEIKKEKIRQYKNYKNKYKSFIEGNLKQSLNNRVFEKLTYIKNIENRLYQEIFDYTYDDYEILRIKEIERVNKLNEERKLNILLKVLNCIINDCGNVSQIFKDNIKKQQLLKDILDKYNIKEKKEGEQNYVNLFNFNLKNNMNYNYQYNKFNKYNHILNENDIFEDKIIREVDEDKEEESVYSNSNRDKNNYNYNYNFNAINNSQNIESIRESIISKNEENEIKNNNNESLNEEKEKKYIEKTPEKKENLVRNRFNDEEKNEIEENEEINIMKDILINNFKEIYGKKSLFNHINKNEFLFDNKNKIFVELNNNEIIIEIEKNKYNLDDFVSIYYKNNNDIATDNKSENKDKNKNEKNNFIYKKKIGQSNKKINEKKQEKEEEKEEENINNEHQKKRRKKRIDNESEEEEEDEKNKEEYNE